MSAYNELLDALNDEERFTHFVIGPWGWGSAPHQKKEAWKPGYREPDPTPVPFAFRGKVLEFEPNKHLLYDWNIGGPFGAPSCYALFAWTNKRVFFVHEYDGSTILVSVPRGPGKTMPSFL